MKRIKRIPVQARLSDTDMHGHINNVAYLSLVEAAHHIYFRDLSCSSPSNVQPFVAHTSIDYLQPALLTDDLSVDMSIESIGSTSLTLNFAVVSHGEEDRWHARGRVVMVYFDTETRTKSVISESLREQVERIEA